MVPYFISFSNGGKIFLNKITLLCNRFSFVYFFNCWGGNAAECGEAIAHVYLLKSFWHVNWRLDITVGLGGWMAEGG